jgi:DNA-binding PadR family transcriptional regulator
VNGVGPLLAPAGEKVQHKKEGLNVDSDIVSDMFDERGGPRSRKFLLPPRGALRVFILRLIEEKPRTGSEIMNEIEKESLGHWRPSPGSVYPMLSDLEDEGYIHGEAEDGTKRYSLQQKGREFLESTKKMEVSEPSWRGRAHLFLPPWLGFGVGQDKLFRAFRRQSVQLFRIRHLVRSGEAPKELEEEALHVIEIASKELDAILEKSRSEKGQHE